MEQQPIIGKIEQLTNVPDYSGGQPHSQNFSHEPYRITHKTKPIIEYEINPQGARFDLVSELVKKICEAHSDDCELHVKVCGLGV